MIIKLASPTREPLQYFMDIINNAKVIKNAIESNDNNLIIETTTPRNRDDEKIILRHCNEMVTPSFDVKGNQYICPFARALDIFRKEYKQGNEKQTA